MTPSDLRKMHKAQLEVDIVSCEICMKEIPPSEARSSEASDYVIHFCGLECYGKWRKQLAEPID
jgi:hypothetical protein